MLIRKSLHGNSRPNPGDLYDPRDGTSLPNFHLSTIHNPNLPHIKQDLVKYDIQLVRELTTNKPVSNSLQRDNLTLMLLAVAEYSETLSIAKRGTSWPFVIHKVFYREAVAGVLHLRHRAGDKDIAMLQSSLRKYIPNPNLHGKQILEQYREALAKISIIQHGQEYHYTNIWMAFSEISKIINQVCSPSNLNARSVLVEIPSELPYNVLDENRYLAYLYEKQRQMREEEEDRRRQQLRQQYRQMTQQQLEAQILYERQTKMNQFSSNYSDKSHHENYYGINNLSSGNDSLERPVIQIRGKLTKYPIATSLKTVNGKKIVTYHDTGEIIVYESVNHAINSPKWNNGISYGGKDDSNLKKQLQMSKSTSNLAENDSAKNRMAGNYSRNSDYASGSRDDSYEEFSIPTESYLRSRSQSQKDLNGNDKIYRYPSLLIEPGRKQAKPRDFGSDWVDKWRKMAPKYWGTNSKKKETSNSTERPKSATQNTYSINSQVHVNKPSLTHTESLGYNRNSNKSTPAFSEEQVKQSTRGDWLQKDDPTYHYSLDSYGQSPTEQVVPVQKQNLSPRDGGRYQESETSSQMLDNSGSSSQDNGVDTLDREFVYRAYPINIRRDD